MGSSSIIMRLIIFTLSALLAFAVAEREFNLCAREEKVCPGGVKPRTPCADGSQPKCPSGRTDTCKPKWKRCADRSEPVRQCATGKPHCPWTTKNRSHPFGPKDIPGFHMLYAQANISKLHLTNMKQQDKMVFGKTNLNKLVLGDFCVRTFIQLISSALECEN